MEKRISTVNLSNVIISLCRAKEIIGANFIEDDLFGNIYIVDAEKINEQFDKIVIELNGYIDIINKKKYKNNNRLVPLMEKFSEKIVNKLTDY